MPIDLALACRKNNSRLKWCMACMRKLMRKLTSLFLILLVPGAMFAAEGDTAVLYGTGTVYLNGAQLGTSSAVTNGDVIQTKETGAANLNAAGSSVVIQSNTIVRFQSGGLALDRGSISVATGRGLSVFARDFKITPASDSWTEFYISRASGVIEIIARKSSLTVSCGTNTATVKEGQQVSREDAANCGIADKGAGATPAAKGPILDSPWAQWGGIGAGGALLLWVLTKCEDPVSPSSPTKNC
jgi:hypothetical protein